MLQPKQLAYLNSVLNSLALCAVLCSILQLESVLNSLEERLRQYHACCHRLALLPAAAKRASGIAYEMSVNRAAATPQELISGDIKVRGCVHVGEGVARRGQWRCVGMLRIKGT
jgi:hypothetical protein